MHNPFSLENKTILVTGASSGIGKAIAIECSKMKANIVISARNKEGLQNTLQLMENDKHKIICADLQNQHDIIKLCDELPNLDGIVHCAGILKTAPFQFINSNQINDVLNTNFYAPIVISQTLLKAKKLNKSSSIVFISSISGVWCSYPASSIYSASKGAVNGLVKGMAIDLAPKGIRVNSVNPGMIYTKFAANEQITPEQLEEDMKRYPLKRYGKPEEIAYAVIYLLSDASSWTTGSNLLIDGGYTLL